MARRATPPSKKQTKAQTTASAAKTSEPAGAELPRRGRKSASTMSEPAEPSLTDIFFPGGEEPVEMSAEVELKPPARARRGREPKAQPDEQAPPSMAADTGVQAENASPAVASVGDGEPSDIQTDPTASPSASQPMQQAAARWDADTGAATFDWPSIEQVAAADGPNQALAKLLLAARAEGANSRWPF